MFTAGIKLLDIVARSLFLLVVLYSLPIRSSGQFGIGLTLIALFAFAAGYERYLDVQRRIVGMPVARVDAMVRHTLRFFAVGYALWVFPFVLGLWAFAQAGLLEICLWVVIAVGEHLSTESYRLALLSGRHRPLLWVGLSKNILLLLVVGALLSLPGPLELEAVLNWWAGLNLVGVIAYSLQLWRLQATIPAAATVLEPAPALTAQFRVSQTHFLVGLVALGSLQVDRLLATFFLSLEQNGVYFRHIFLAAAAYQASGILSHNRVVQKLYANIRSESPSVAKRILTVERRRFVIVSLAVIGCLGVLESVKSVLPASLQFLDGSMLVLLVFAYALRGVADYNALVLNAQFKERVVLRAQTCAVMMAATAGGLLIQVWSMTGLAVGAVLGSATYLLMTRPGANKVLDGSDRTT